MLADSAENDTFLKRDAVFAKVNFCLQSALIKLTGDTHRNHSEENSLMELKCSAIQMEFESRPRSNGI